MYFDRIDQVWRIERTVDSEAPTLPEAMTIAALSASGVYITPTGIDERWRILWPERGIDTTAPDLTTALRRVRYVARRAGRAA